MRESSRRIPYRIAARKYEETRYRELYYEARAVHGHKNRKREKEREEEGSSGASLLTLKPFELVILSRRTADTPH